VSSARYRLGTVSARGGLVTASCGMTLATTPIGDVRPPIDTLLIAGGTGVVDAALHQATLQQVRRLARRARRVGSVCTGAFVLAAAGLLDGHRAVTHWQWCNDFAERFPHVTVVPDAIFVHDGDLWTSAGVTAGIDLALALLDDDHGRQAAATVARHLVVYLRRPGGQAQYSAPLAAQSTDNEPLRDLLTWIPDNLTADQSVHALAEKMHLSERQFTRVFKAATGTTPAAHVEAVRLEAACRLLETTELPIAHVARASGFGVPETLHRAFRRRLHTTPTERRRHFS
jgi:transcriptional regulator GlxA family with amidase domain